MSVKLVWGCSLLCSVCCFTTVADNQFNTCEGRSTGASVVKNVLLPEDKVYSGRESGNAKTYIYLLRSLRAGLCGCTCSAGLRLGAIRVESEGEFGRFRIPKEENERCGVIWSAFVSFGEEKVKFSYYFGRNYSDSFLYDENGNALLKDSGDFFHYENGKEILCKECRDSYTNELSIESILKMTLFRWKADGIETLTEFFKRVSMVGKDRRVEGIINERKERVKVLPGYDPASCFGYNCATFSEEALSHLLGQQSIRKSKWKWIGSALGATAGAASYFVPCGNVAYRLGSIFIGGGAFGFVGGYAGTGKDNAPASVANRILSTMKKQYKSADEEGKRELEDSFKIIFRTKSDINSYKSSSPTRREGISYAQRSVTLADIGSSNLKAKSMENGGKVTVFLDTDFDPSEDATNLMSAACRGRLTDVCNLLDKGTSPNIRGNSGMTALILAAQKGNPNVVDVLVKRKADLNARDDSGKTALMYAARRGHENVVEILLANKASPNIQDNDGKTALMYAARRGHENVVKILLTNKASPNIQDNDGKTAKILAEQSRYSDIQQQSNNDVDADILMWAVQEGGLNFVNNLLDKGVDPNVQNSLGETALMWAEKEKHSDIVRVLLSKGADPNVQDNRGRTASMWAVTG